ncbi:MFS transporter, partial [Winogradskyella sp. ZXX205]|nr:MFS transporter [Winogradskyella ouciana]
YIVIQLEAGFTFLYWGGSFILLILAAIWIVLANRLNTFIKKEIYESY